MTSASTVRTGIEVHAKWSDYMKDMAHLAYDVGLGWTAKVAAKWWKVKMTVDGRVVADEPVFADHVAPCEPGQHVFGFKFYRPVLGQDLAFFSELTASVTVEPGKVTQVIFMQHAMNLMNELIVVGAWPWVDPAASPTVTINAFDGKQYPAHALYRARGMTMVQFPNGWRHWVDDSAIA